MSFIILKMVNLVYVYRGTFSADDKLTPENWTWRKKDVKCAMVFYFKTVNCCISTGNNIKIYIPSSYYLIIRI